MNRPLGCLTGAGVLAGALTALALAAVAIASGNALFSAGQLNAQPGARSLGGVASHAELSRECSTCHPAIWDADRMGDRCMACHSEVKEELHTKSGFHFGMAAASNCRDCHTDHNGADAALTHREIVDFPHERTAFVLQAHPVVGGEFQCLDCHGDSLRSFSDSACLSCHSLLEHSFADRHLDDFGEDCLACHDGVDRYGGDFAHTVFALDGEHLELRCSACHTAARDVSDLEAAPQACVACHRQDDLHAGRLGPECQQCHEAAGWEGATIDHALTRFALRGAHEQVECEGCHYERQWIGLPTGCAGCHAPDGPHGGQFVQDCGACHVETAWTDLIFDHAQTSYPLLGAHQLADCAGCHENGRYVDTPTACVACHRAEDEHNGRFGEQCSACHQPTQWSDVTFDHSLSAFPLTGAHASASCEGCHPNAAFAGTSTACVACHAEPAVHRGMFGTDCAACHTTTAWLPASYNGPHAFPINHEGAGGQCSLCHPSSLLSYTCYECHNANRMQNEHEGIGNLADCARCHPTGDKEEGGDDD